MLFALTAVVLACISTLLEQLLRLVIFVYCSVFFVVWLGEAQANALCLLELLLVTWSTLLLLIQTKILLVIVQILRLIVAVQA